MIDKTVPSLHQAVADVRDGATVLVGGFGASGVPTELLCALLDQGARELTIVNNNGGNGPVGLSQLFLAGRVRKLICSFARSANPAQPSAAAFAEVVVLAVKGTAVEVSNLRPARDRAARAYHGLTRALHGRGHLQQQRGLADARFSAEQNDPARHESAAQNPVKAGQARTDPLLHEGREDAQIHGTVGGLAPPGHGFGRLQGIPALALGTLALPARGHGPAGRAAVSGLRFHGQ